MMARATPPSSRKSGTDEPTKIQALSVLYLVDCQFGYSADSIDKYVFVLLKKLTGKR